MSVKDKLVLMAEIERRNKDRWNAFVSNDDDDEVVGEE